MLHLMRRSAEVEIKELRAKVSCLLKTKLFHRVSSYSAMKIIISPRNIKNCNIVKSKSKEYYY